MFRTFVDINGNIQYVPNVTYPIPTPNAGIFEPVYLNDPYSNSSLIITPTYSDSDDKSIIGYNVFPRTNLYSNSTLSDVNNDPELRKKVVKYLYEKFATVWLPFSFIKLQRYLKNTNGEITFIKTIGDYEKELVNDDKKIEFILENIFSKHELLVFLDKFVNVNNVNWYDLKTKHIEKIKTQLYDKLKNHMKKIVVKHI